MASLTDTLALVSEPLNETLTYKWLVDRVEALLSHYYQPAANEDALELSMDTWTIGLRGFTKDQIDIACVHWELNEPKRRPTPADIVALCREVRALQNPRPALPAPEPEVRGPVATPEQRLEIIRQVYGPEADASEVARTLAARAALTDGDPR
jgi:hypothetical protein